MIRLLEAIGIDDCLHISFPVPPLDRFYFLWLKSPLVGPQCRGYSRCVKWKRWWWTYSERKGRRERQSATGLSLQTRGPTTTASVSLSVTSNNHHCYHFIALHRFALSSTSGSVGRPVGWPILLRWMSPSSLSRDLSCSIPRSLKTKTAATAIRALPNIYFQ